MKEIVLIAGIILLLTLCAYSQIQGDVIDQNEKGIPNAVVIATDTVTKMTDTVKSDHRGFYDFKGLKPGIYKIEAMASGFQHANYENIEVKDGDIGHTQVDLYRGQRLQLSLAPLKVK